MEDKCIVKPPSAKIANSVFMVSPKFPQIVHLGSKADCAKLGLSLELQTIRSCS
jgi:hypothetical protein